MKPKDPAALGKLIALRDMRPRDLLLDWVKSLTHKQKQRIFLAIDLALVPVALVFTVITQGHVSDIAAWSRDVLVPMLAYLLIGALALALWMGIGKVRLQDFEHRAVGRTARYAVGLCVLLWGIDEVLARSISLGTVVIFGTTYFIASVGLRLLARQAIISLYESAAPRCRVLIYGAGKTGSQLAHALRSDGGIVPAAFVDDNPSLHGIDVAGARVFSPAHIQDIVTEKKIDRVLIATPSLSLPKQMQIAQRVQDLGLEVQTLPSFAQLVGTEDILDTLTALPASQFLGREEVLGSWDETSNSYAGKCVLITGAGGTIGAELSQQVLACRPSRIVLYELSEYALYTLHMDLSGIAAKLGVDLVPVLGSVSDETQVARVFEDFDVEIVFHAAAYKHVPLVEANPIAGLANNVMGTQILARAAHTAGVERFILISSDKAVRPCNVMGGSKRLSELIIQDIASRVPAGSGPIYSMVRFGNVLGSSGSVIPLFKDQIRRGGPVTVTDPEVTRYFMTVQEAVRLVITAGAMAEGSEVFVLEMGKPVKIMDLAKDVIESSGYTVRDEDSPDGDIEIEIIGLRPGEKLAEELTITDDHVRTRHPKIFCAHESKLSEIEMAHALRKLREAIAENDAEAARSIVAQCVEPHVPVLPLEEAARRETGA